MINNKNKKRKKNLIVFFFTNKQTRVYKDEANKCGPVHITIGDGGNREGLASK